MVYYLNNIKHMQYTHVMVCYIYINAIHTRYGYILIYFKRSMYTAFEKCWDALCVSSLNLCKE